MTNDYPHPLEQTRYILDPIHGAIRLTDYEIKLVDTEIFRRLRRVKQNGLLYLVFPSATHTRFEHSLGTMYLADAILRSLFENSISGRSKGQPRIRAFDEAGAGESVDIRGIGNEEVKFLFQVTRLAALAHDLGHGPLSHAFDETFAPTPDEMKGLLNGADWQDLRLIGRVGLDGSGEENVGVEHEYMSCVLFAVAWNQIRPAIQQKASYEEYIPASVAGAILGQPELQRIANEVDLPQRYHRWLPLISDIISSAPADADRMDYLERDSRSIGVTYGLYDRSRVLKSLLCWKEKGEGQDRFRLGIKKSGVQAIENFIQARYQLFVQVYYHKTNRAVTLMLQKISNVSDEKRNNEHNIINSSSLQALVKSYVELDDHHFLRRLRDTEADEGGELSSIADAIFERRLWKRLVACSTTEEAHCYQELLADRDGADVCVDRVQPHATKDLKDGAALLTKDNVDRVYAADGVDWTDDEVSPIISKLADEEKNIVRLYLREDDSSRAEKLRDTIRSVGADRDLGEEC